ncbi:PEP/pyruvate-binding domain-containing protein [Methanococcoides methylutens]|uniref:PEP/pyruvate-binding domain-containing protein n=1 Tax=Methanococcoides methylutens TaxID=2226 RepID=UPI00404407F5
MTPLIISMVSITEEDKENVGGKAYSLSRLREKGFNVPKYFCVTADAYRKFLRDSGLEGQILLEIARKDFGKMRWEEMWDTSLRLKNLFLNASIPEGIENAIRSEIEKNYGQVPVVVRSSAPGEDSANTSFAGIHESYVNVRGVDSILEHVKLVWASLWSDAAILYREELGLDIKESSMAVVVQELVEGERSGIVFSKDPNNESHLVIESVYGLNEGLVSGDIEPDRWILDRKNGAIIQHVVASDREKSVRLKEGGTYIEKLSSTFSDKEPLSNDDINRIYEMAMLSEKVFDFPQDMEWTIRNDEIFLLQSRPITTLEDKEKSWYISLRRTFDNLKALRIKIEDILIPEMISDSGSMSSIDLQSLNDTELADVVVSRRATFEKWDSIYTKEFIPFAHGMRLFGDVYNEKMKPSDPYEFMDLLSNSDLLSMRRNRKLNLLAGMIRKDDSLRKNIESGNVEGDFAKRFDEFMELFGRSSYVEDKGQMIKLILELSSHPEKEITSPKDPQELIEDFLAIFDQNEKKYASDLLDIGRASYKLRDDDNIYLGRIEGHYLESVKEGKRRLSKRGIDQNISDDDIIKALKENNFIPKTQPVTRKLSHSGNVRIRQIQGQPASKGIVTGTAKVIETKDDLFAVRSGQILVCDAIDPNMTFVIPLVSGIVERRGGMLIHGAIIAREYGIPCVTGIPDAVDIINTGDEVTVDGYLGIVVIQRK